MRLTPVYKGLKEVELVLRYRAIRMIVVIACAAPDIRPALSLYQRSGLLEATGIMATALRTSEAWRSVSAAP